MSLAPPRLCLDHSHCPVLAPATLVALPSTRAIPDRDVFYVADPISFIQFLAADTAATTVVQLMHRKRLIMCEGSQQVRNRLEAFSHSCARSLDNVGSDNLAWSVEIASDRSTKATVAHEILSAENFRL